MSTETEDKKKVAIHQAMGAALSKAAKEHPKKTIGLGVGLSLVGLLLQFGAPLCGLLPNPIASSICSTGAKVVSKVVEEATPVEPDGEPSVKVDPGGVKTDE